MAKVILYTSGFCHYCVQARRLLEAKGVVYDELYIDRDPALRAQMEGKTQRRSVPQIFIGDYHVGGYEDMRQLDKSGQLDALLQGCFTNYNPTEVP
ncbi:MAG: glutaredoxin 3 [Gammaproteobacteria bacterium]